MQTFTFSNNLSTFTLDLLTMTEKKWIFDRLAF